MQKDTYLPDIYICDIWYAFFYMLLNANYGIIGAQILLKGDDISKTCGSVNRDLHLTTEINKNDSNTITWQKYTLLGANSTFNEKNTSRLLYLHST